MFANGRWLRSVVACPGGRVPEDSIAKEGRLCPGATGENVATAKSRGKKKTKPVLLHARLASLCYQFKLLPDANSPCRRPEFKFINAP